MEKRKQRPVPNSRKWIGNVLAKNIGGNVNRMTTIVEWPRNVTSGKGLGTENANGNESGIVREIVPEHGNAKGIDLWNGTGIGGVPPGIDVRWSAWAAMAGCTIHVIGIVGEVEAGTGTAIVTTGVDMIAIETIATETEGIDVVVQGSVDPRTISLRTR